MRYVHQDRLLFEEATGPSSAREWALVRALQNSNSLSSIDLSNAYNGISSYSIPLVGTLTFISNWAEPIWWSLAAVWVFATKQSGGDGGGGYVDWIGWSAFFHGIG